MSAFYNEFDPYAAQWLENLIREGLITDGIVDQRDIRDVDADVSRFARCHWFAGIAGWDYALQLAGWPADRPVWTASLPCQPFSAAGQRKGGEDDRHLWPVFYGHVRKHRPATILGEQVEAAIGHGWLDRVFADLEAEGYACGAVSLPACSVGAPHIRQRVFWVADACSERRQQISRSAHGDESADGRESHAGNKPSGRGEDGRLEHATSEQARIPGRAREPRTTDRMGNPQGERRGEAGREHSGGPEKWTSLPSFWTDFEFIPCADGKARRIESGTFPLAHGVSGRVGKLRAYGNAIVPALAAEFVKAVMEVL